MQPQVIQNPHNPVQRVWEHNLGLVPAKIGAEFAHKIGVAMPLLPPQHPTTEAQKNALAPVRTRLAPSKKLYEFGRNDIDGSLCATKALPGATVYLVVQDLSRLELELVALVKWQCRHPDCASVRWDSKEELFGAHDENRLLIAQAKADPRGPKAHIYLGVLEVVGKPEIPGITEKRDEHGKVTAKAVPPVPGSETLIILLSDEA